MQKHSFFYLKLLKSFIRILSKRSYMFFFKDKKTKKSSLGAVPKSFAKRDIKLTSVSHPQIT